MVHGESKPRQRIRITFIHAFEDHIVGDLGHVDGIAKKALDAAVEPFPVALGLSCSAGSLTVRTLDSGRR
jgi:hypothetical protein